MPFCSKVIFSKIEGKEKLPSFWILHFGFPKQNHSIISTIRTKYDVPSILIKETFCGLSSEKKNLRILYLPSNY